MARRPRLRIAGVPQHVIQRGNNRQATFFVPEDQGCYLACLQHAARRHDCAIHAYRELFSGHLDEEVLTEIRGAVDRSRRMGASEM